MEYILIDKEAIPYKFEIDLKGDVFTFEVNYNERFDFFTVDIEQGGETIATGAKIVYDNPVFNFTNDPRLPNVTIKPVDDSSTQTRAGYEQIGESVFLLVEAKA